MNGEDETQPRVDASGVELLIRSLLNRDGDRLRSESEIASGGMGTVERVVDRALRRYVAKKTLRPAVQRSAQGTRMFIREAHIACHLDHPNIVPVHDIGLDAAGRLYFTMKLVEGRTFAELIAALPPIPLETSVLLDSLEVIVKVCDALSLAHSRNVIHCDIKPENIMVGDFGEVFLMDWGAAQFFVEDSTAKRASPEMDTILTEEQLSSSVTDATFVGTLAYMSPEQAGGIGDLLSPRTDIFCLGATLYELLTRRAPYGGGSYWTNLGQARECCFEALRDDDTVPPALSRIVSKAMCRRPEDRYRSIAELKSELVQFMRGREMFRRLRFSRGEHIVREGERGDAAFIVDSGECEIYQSVGGKPVRVRIVGAGDVFGEMAILSPGPRTASVVALDSVTVQVVTKRALERELEAMRPWMATLIRSLADRFRQLDEGHHQGVGD